MIIIHDKRLPAEYKEALRKKFPLARLWPFKGGGNVYESISCHPDIYFFQLDDKTLIHSPGVSSGQVEELKKFGLSLIPGKEEPCGVYPRTVKYNVVRMGKVLVHNIKHTDPCILEISRQRGLKSADVAQGYARCSVMKITENALITSDASITKAARTEGLDALQVSPGNILLPGERTGFPGGTSGNLPDGTVLILGDVGFHPQALQIKGFMDKYSVQYVDLPGLPLYDAGGLLIFD